VTSEALRAQGLTHIYLFIVLFRILGYIRGTNEFAESIWCLRRNELTVVIFCLFNHRFEYKNSI